MDPQEFTRRYPQLWPPGTELEFLNTQDEGMEYSRTECVALVGSRGGTNI